MADPDLGWPVRIRIGWTTRPQYRHEAHETFIYMEVFP